MKEVFLFVVGKSFHLIHLFLYCLFLSSFCLFYIILVLKAAGENDRNSYKLDPFSVFLYKEEIQNYSAGMFNLFEKQFR